MSRFRFIIDRDYDGAVCAVWAATEGGKWGVMEGDRAAASQLDTWRTRMRTADDPLAAILAWGDEPLVSDAFVADSMSEIRAALRAYDGTPPEAQMLFDDALWNAPSSRTPEADTREEVPETREEDTWSHGPDAWSSAWRESVWERLSAQGIQAAAAEMFGRGEGEHPDPHPAASVVMEALYIATQNAMPARRGITVWRGWPGPAAPPRELKLLPASSWATDYGLAERVARRSRTRGFVVAITVPPERIIAAPSFARDGEVIVSGGRIHTAGVDPFDGEGDLAVDSDGGPERGTANWLRY